MIINTHYLKIGSGVGLTFSDWWKIKAKVYLNTQDSQHLIQTNKTHQEVLERWMKFGKNKGIPF